MPVLHVEEVPAELYQRIEKRAAAQKRDVNKEVIHLLQQTLVAEEDTARAAHLAALAALRRSRQTAAAGAPSSVELLREDRER